MEQTTADLPPQETADTVTITGFKTSQGVTMQATALRLTPQSVTFEVYGPQITLRLSEVLTDFNILVDGWRVYGGKAVVNHMVNTGTVTVCEAAISGPLLPVDLLEFARRQQSIPTAYQSFLTRWQKNYRILPEYKLAVTDLQNFLQELRMWLDQIELDLIPLPAGERAERERAILRELPATPAITTMFERFEIVAGTVPEELLPAHRAFCRRQLHPLLMTCPFMHRIFTKPLGYAGDYEMIDMIIRNDYEGGSLFAKLLQNFILDQAPARSVRNRADYFKQKFIEETSRVASLGRPASFFSLGCGPAREVEFFLTEHSLSDRTQFQLLDFNQETLERTGGKLAAVCQKHHRRTPVHLVRKSVHTLIKEAGKPISRQPGFDLIYCSGLYDYLSDRVCKTLNTHLYDQLLPGGTLIVTNFDPYNPIQNIMEHIFEWFLIHRDSRQMAALAPEQAASADCVVRAEPSGCNVFLEAQKPLEQK